jgi:transcriptional regulator with XRE-family HTH domain
MNEKEYLIELGNNIKRIRQKRKISQVELADVCNFEKQNMQRIEAGKTNPTVKTLLKIAQALEISVIELFKF